MIAPKPGPKGYGRESTEGPLPRGTTVLSPDEAARWSAQAVADRERREHATALDTEALDAVSAYLRSKGLVIGRDGVARYARPANPKPREKYSAVYTAGSWEPQEVRYRPQPWGARTVSK